MAEQLTHASFADRVGEAFRLVLADEAAEPLEIELVSYRALEGTPGHTKREQAFAIEFRGPTEKPFPQGLWRVEHPELGGHDIFLVPVGPDDSGLCYEAVFN